MFDDSNSNRLINLNKDDDILSNIDILHANIGSIFINYENSCRDLEEASVV